MPKSETKPKPNLNDFYNQVSRLTDTDGTQINVAETKRVLAKAFDCLQMMTPAEASHILSKGLEAAEKRRQ